MGHDPFRHHACACPAGIHLTSIIFYKPEPGAPRKTRFAAGPQSPTRAPRTSRPFSPAKTRASTAKRSWSMRRSQAGSTARRPRMEEGISAKPRKRSIPAVRSKSSSAGKNFPTRSKVIKSPVILGVSNEVEKMRPYYRFGLSHVVGVELMFHRIQKLWAARTCPPAAASSFPITSASWIPTTVGWAVAREIYYLGRKSLFKPPFWSWFLPICNVLPIDRDGRDTTGLRRIIRMLKEGRAVLPFSRKGTRSVRRHTSARRAGRGTHRAQGRRAHPARPRVRHLRKPFPSHQAPAVSSHPRCDRKALPSIHSRRPPRQGILRSHRPGDDESDCRPGRSASGLTLTLGLRHSAGMQQSYSILKNCAHV